MAEVTDEVPISHLQRRRIESRVLIPFIAACREKFGEAATKDLVVATIRRLAVEDGARWAEAFGRDMHSLKSVAEKVWAGGGSLDIDMVAAGDDRLDFNVTRCRYAEFYKELGLADLGLSWCLRSGSASQIRRVWRRRIRRFADSILRRLHVPRALDCDDDHRTLE